MDAQGRGREHAFRACSLNVRGLHHPAKFAAVLAWAQERPYTAVVIQECHLRTSPFQWVRHTQGADAVWKGQSFYEPGTGKSRGCLVLLKASAIITNVKRVDLSGVPGAVGRVIRVDFELGGRPASLVCVYAPAKADARTGFFSSVLPLCLPTQGERAVFMGGDFNCIVDAMDYVGPAIRGAQRATELGAKHLANIMAGGGRLDLPPAPPWLVDAWRQTHPDTRDATHFSHSPHSRWAPSPGRTGARLDRWLVSADALQ